MISLFKKNKLGGGRRRGFTIIELLVALTITAVIATLMVTILINVLGTWQRSSARMSNGNQARVILDQITQDLQGAILHSSTDVTLAATIQNNQSGQGDSGVASADWSGTDVKPGNTSAPNGSLEINPTDRDLLNYRFGQTGVWLRFFSTPPDNSDTALNNLSVPRAIAYQIVRRQIGSSTAPYVYQLFRSEVRPYGTSGATNRKSTFTQGFDLFSNNGYNNPDDSSDGGTNADDPGVIRRPRADYTIGDGVIDFGIRAFARDNTGALLEMFPMDRRGGAATARRVLAATTDSSKTQPLAAFPSGLANMAAGNTSYGYPNVIEVSIRILTPEGVGIIQNYEANPAVYGGASASKWWELAEANSNVYVRRVELPSRVN